MRKKMTFSTGKRWLFLLSLLILSLPSSVAAQIVVAPAQAFINGAGVALGPIRFTSTFCNPPSLSNAAATSSGIGFNGAATYVCNGGARAVGFNGAAGGQVEVGSGGSFSFSTTTDASATPDIVLYRSAAKTLKFDSDGVGGALTSIIFIGPITASQITAGASANLTLDAQVAGVIAANKQLLLNGSILGAGPGNGSTDGSLSRLGAASFALGNGTAGDFTGALKLNVVNSITGYQYQGVSVIDVSSSTTNIQQWGSGGILLNAANGVKISNNVSSVNGVATVGQGIPYIVGTTGLLSAQGANIGSTTIPGASSVANGQYEVCAFEAVTRAATTSSTLGTVTLGFNNGTAGNSVFLIASPNSGNTTTAQLQGCAIIHAGAATALTYSTGSYATSGGTSMQYELYITARSIY